MDSSLRASGSLKNNFNIKLVLEDEIRIIPRPPNTISSLHETIKRTFKERTPKAYTLSYIDSDGDRINLDLDEDLEALYDLNTEKKSIKIEIVAVHEDYEIIKKAEEIKPESKIIEEKNILIEQPKVEIIEKKGSSLIINTSVEKNVIKEIENSPSIFEQSDKKNVMQRKSSENDASLSFSLNREIKVIPEKITVTNSAFIYFSLSIKNTGLLNFPKKLRFFNVSESLRGEAVSVLPLNVGEDISLTLVLENPRIAGSYVAFWELRTANEEVVGTIVYPIEIIDEKLNVSDKAKYGVIKAQPKIQYKPEVVEKAKVVQGIFGGDLQKYQELIASKNYTHLDDIIEEILEQNKAMALFNKSK